MWPTQLRIRNCPTTKGHGQRPGPDSARHDSAPGPDSAPDMTPPRPGGAPVGAEVAGRYGLVGQLSAASASFQVADGRMTAAALAGSGW